MQYGKKQMLLALIPGIALVVFLVFTAQSRVLDLLLGFSLGIAYSVYKVFNLRKLGDDNVPVKTQVFYYCFGLFILLVVLTIGIWAPVFDFLGVVAGMLVYPLVALLINKWFTKSGQE